MALAVVSSLLPSSVDSVDVVQPGPAHPEKRIRTALVLRKTTKWDYTKEQYPRKSDAEIELRLKKAGEDVRRLRESDRQQKDVVRRICQRLEQHGVVTRSVSRHELSAWVGWADLVIAAGGDGTFLTAAAAVRDLTPTIGINSDPVGSEGHLCLGGKNTPPDVIERIVNGHFKWTDRCRIRVTLLNREHEAKNKCILALNEVFVGENDAARVSTYDISRDDEPYVKQKSSGLIVTTGTGSTSWYSSVKRVEDHDVQQIMKALQATGLMNNVEGLEEKAQEIAKMVNDKVPFESDHPNFAYVIREPIFNGTFSRMSTSGFARRIRLRSRCAQGLLVLDGSTKIRFDAGAEVLLEMLPADALRTISLTQ